MKKKFAEGLSFYKIFIIFIVCSIFGTFYEQIYHLINHFVRTGIFEWSIRQSVLYGPFNFVYGVGGVLMVCLLVPIKENWKAVYGFGCLLGGSTEYFLSYLQEKLFGTVSWDYTNRLLNIDGRTTIPYMMFWGLLCLFAVYKIYPFVSKMIEKIPSNIGVIVSKCLLVFILLDGLISLIAVTRQSLRNNGVEPYTVIGRLCDTYYTDEYLGRISFCEFGLSWRELHGAR